MALCRVITVSDRCAAGERDDASGPLLAESLSAAGHEVSRVVVPDGADSVQSAIRAAVADGVRLIVTTGGTGVGPRDRTPEGTRAAIDRELPGVAELLRTRGLAASGHAALSRGVVGVLDATPDLGGTLVVNLPGSPAAVRDAVPAFLPLVSHVLDQLAGVDH